MVSEFRALRATVLRLWSASMHGATEHDLEDLTRFNEAVDQTLAESLKFFVAEVDRARNLFLGVLGHDLRTPLGTIMSCAHYQLRARPGTEREAKLILQGASHMKALIDDLLAYTRDKLGVGMSVERAPMRLDRFARDTLDAIAAMNPGSAIDLQAEGDMEGAWDASRLHQVLSNLVVNALKYGAPGAPVHVGLDGTREDGVVLRVHNRGPTIPAHILPDLFEPLVRGNTQPAGSLPSGADMGLGLYIAREIITAHGGTIAATSSDAAGTCFEVRLPRSDARLTELAIPG
jgi:signal transduction histidine kinase